MAYSMTGFGKGANITPDRKCTVEIKSVNSRYCDIQIRLPRILNSIENRIRTEISSGMKRGKIDVYVSYEDYANKYKHVVVDAALVESYKEALDKVSGMLGKREKIGASTICRFDDVFKIQTEGFDEGFLWDFVGIAVTEALSDINSMRKSEGDALIADIKEKLGYFSELHGDIAERAPQLVREFASRYKKRIKELEKDLGDEKIDEQRVAAEITLYAEKCSIDEELVRLGSHLKQLGKTLEADGPIGKKADFIIQEINRETNTIGSKANDLEITGCVMEIKTVTENIREQIQNIQ